MSSRRQSATKAGSAMLENCTSLMGAARAQSGTFISPAGFPATAPAADTFPATAAAATFFPLIRGSALLCSAGLQ